MSGYYYIDIVFQCKVKKITYFLLLLLFLSVPAITVYGAVFEKAEQYTLAEGDILHDDLYVGAGSVTVAGAVVGDVFSGGGRVNILGNVTGDVVVGGGTVVVAGDVSQDLTLFGGEIDILGAVGDDVRAVGGQITVVGDVDDDLVVAGGLVHVVSGATIGGKAVIVGGELIVDGIVRGDLRVVGDKISINGTVGGDTVITAGESLSVGESAVLRLLSYEAPKEAVISDGAVVSGEVIFEQTKRSGREAVTKTFGGALLFVLAAIIAFGVLAVVFLADGSQRLVKDALSLFGRRVVWGVITLIIIPVAIGVLFVSILGATIGVFAGLLYAASILISWIYAGIIFGSLIRKLITRSSEIRVTWVTALFGILLLSFIVSVPLIGWIVGLVFFLVAFGSFAHAIYKGILTLR